MKNHGRSWFLFLLLAFACLGSAWAEVAGQFTAVTGDVRVQRGTATRAVAVGEDALEGDTLITGSPASAQLKMIDGGILAVLANSRVRLDQYTYHAANPKDDNVVLSLLAGTLRTFTGALVDRNRDQYLMKTPVASIGIRGSENVLNAAADGTTINHTVSGAHSVTSTFAEGPGRTVTSNAGQTVQVRKGLIPVFIAAPAFILEIARQTLAAHAGGAGASSASGSSTSASTTASSTASSTASTTAATTASSTAAVGGLSTAAIVGGVAVAGVAAAASGGGGGGGGSSGGGGGGGGTTISSFVGNWSGTASGTTTDSCTSGGFSSSTTCTFNVPWTGVVDSSGNFTITYGNGTENCTGFSQPIPLGGTTGSFGQVSASGSIPIPAQSVSASGFTTSCPASVFQFTVSPRRFGGSYTCNNSGSISGTTCSGTAQITWSGS